MASSMSTPQNTLKRERGSATGVTVVLPAYNEESAINSTLDEVELAMTRLDLPFEMLVVDDGSADQTAIRAAAKGARVVVHPVNAGYGRALKSGIETAQYDTIVITDADCTYPVDRIGELLAEFDRGVHMVIAQRHGAAYEESIIKWPLRRVLKGLVEYVSGKKVPDVNSGLRVFSRAEIKGYFPHLCDTFSFTSSLTLAYLMSGRFVKFIPMPYRERTGRTKVRLIQDSLRSLQYVFQQAIYYNPLKIFFTLAGLCLALSIVFLWLGAAFKLTTAFILAAGSFLVGLVVIALGILGELLRQIMGQALVERPAAAADAAQPERRAPAREADFTASS